MSPSYNTTGVYRELIELMAEMDRKFLEPERGLDEQAHMAGYRWIFSILQVACDVYLWGDPKAPRFVDIVGPYKKWGGDNADAYYQFAPVDPNRTYRISGKAGDAVYFSLTVYGGPNDGHYTENITGIVNNRDLGLAEDGSFEFLIGPKKPDDYEGTFLQLAPDSVHALTRDYIFDARKGRRVEWKIEALDDPGQYRDDDAETARRLRAVITWLKDQQKMVPLAVKHRATDEEERVTTGHSVDFDANAFARPYPVPKQNFGWSAGDASYAFGSYDLQEDEALVIEHAPPECAFWNLSVWNPFMGALNYDYERTSLNREQVQRNADGSVTVVVSPTPLDHPNAATTQGYPRGTLCFRWFLAESTPDAVRTRVVPATEALSHLP